MLDKMADYEDAQLLARISALEEKLASYDVRLTCLEQLLVETDSDEFEQFYKKYPHKKAPRDAAKAFKAARKRASFEDIMAGLVKYIKHKPSDQKYAYPASWLNADRWLDNYAEAPEAAPGEPEASTEGKDTPIAIDALTAWVKSLDQYERLSMATAIRTAFCARRDRDLYILAACSDNVPEMKRFVPWWNDKHDDEVKRFQAQERTKLDAISMDLGYGPIQWPRSS